MISVYQERERGFSLIEVLVSLGLLAGVMVAVSSLFIFGGKEVKSGKRMTEAYSIGHDIVEEMDRMTYTQAYQYFLPLGTSPTAAQIQTYTDANDNYTIWTDGSEALTAAADATRDAYQANIDSKLYNGRASIKFEGLSATGTPAVFSACVALRVTVMVQWDEGANTRYLNLRTVRF